MRKNVIALSAAALVAGLGLAGGASAAVIFDTASTAATATTRPGAPATRFSVQPGGVGHMLVFPYYTVQGGNSTLINLVNTDTRNGKAVKVRFRSAANSDDVFDFQLFLSPGDVWAANISKGSDGRAMLTTTDKSCTLPTSVNQSFVLDRMTGATGVDTANWTREGYIEVFNMADIPRFEVTYARGDETLTGDAATGTYATNGSGLPTSLGNGLYNAIKHVNGVPSCAPAQMNTLVEDPANLERARVLGFRGPTSGLFGNYSIVNMSNTVSFSGEATSIVAHTGWVGSNGSSPDSNGRGNIVFSPQTFTGVGNVDAFTADPLLRTEHAATQTGVQNGSGGAYPGTGPIVTPLQFDLPDLSTPYVGFLNTGAVATPFNTTLAPIAQAQMLTDALAASAVQNEYMTSTSIAGATDWVLSMPTRRYSVAMDYAANARAFTDLPGSDWFTAGNTTIGSGEFAREICVTTAKPTYFADREETTPTPSTVGFVISPGTAATPQGFNLCGEVSVLSINAGGNTKPSVLSASVARGDITLPYQNGWMSISTPAASVQSPFINGLPIIGKAFMKATNPASSPGVAANFGISFEHRYQR